MKKNFRIFVSFLLFWTLKIISKIFIKSKIKILPPLGDKKSFKFDFSQKNYDDLFHCIENDLRELGFGDVSVNKKMKELNKILYDILLKINKSDNAFTINEKLVLKYFDYLKENSNSDKYGLFDEYFTKFYHFCFELQPKTMIKDALKFEVI